MTGTGHQYSQIPGAQVETELEESGETSLKNDCFGHTVTLNETAEPEKDNEDLEADLCESREFNDVIVGEQEVSKQEDVADAASLFDVRTNQPTSIQEKCREDAQLTESSLQEVLVGTTGLNRKNTLWV